MIETKLLLGGQAAPGWHWGANLSVEQATSGRRSTERQATLGLSYTVIDRVLQVGGEARVMYTDERGSRGTYVKRSGDRAQHPIPTSDPRCISMSHRCGA